MAPDPAEFLEETVMLLDRKRFGSLCEATRAVRGWGDLPRLQTFWNQYRGKLQPPLLNWLDDDIPDGMEPGLDSLLLACGRPLDVAASYAGLLPSSDVSLRSALFPPDEPVHYRWLERDLDYNLSLRGRLLEVRDAVQLPPTLPEYVESGLFYFFETYDQPLKMKNESRKLRAAREIARREAKPVLDRWRIAYPHWRSLLLAELEPLVDTSSVLAIAF